MIEIVIDERKLKTIIREYLQKKLGDIIIKEEDILIEVKSKQNYRSEWEVALFKATFRKHNLD